MAKAKKQVKREKEKSTGRVRKLTKKQSKKEARKVAKSNGVASGYSILKTALKHFYKHKKIFIGILLVYALVTIMFARGLASNFQLTSINEQLNEAFGEPPQGVTRGAILFGLLLESNTTASSDVGGVYQMIFIIIASLAIIWVLRQTFAEKTGITVKDAFYKSTQPLIPFLAVALVIGLQAIPFILAASIYGTVQSGGLALTGIEQVLWTSLLIIGTLVSLFFMSSSVLALYIVTLPGTRPLAALKAAKGLVKFRRITIIRRMLFYPFVALTVLAAVMIPLILIFSPAAEVVFLIVSLLMLGITHAYYYSLYRSLL